MTSSELIRVGIDLEELQVPPVDEESPLFREIFDQVQAEYERVSALWFERMRELCERAGITNSIVSHVWLAETILGMPEHPPFKFVYGIFFGLLNHRGYCWEDENEVMHIGLDEGWFEHFIETNSRSSGSYENLKSTINSVMIEEVFHAFIRQKYPELAEENIAANASGNPSDYWRSWGEKAAKEFASWLVSKSPASESSTE